MYFWLIFPFSLLCCYILYSYFHKRTNIFEKAGVPYIKPWPIVGNVGPVILQKTSFPEVLSKFYYLNRNAKYVGFYQCEMPVIIIRDPELIKLIGTKQFNIFYNRKGLATVQQDPIVGYNLSALKDENWYEMRHILSPTFNPYKNKLFFQLISQKAQDISNHVLKTKLKDINMKPLFRKLQFEILINYSLGLSLNLLQNEDDFYEKQFKAMSLEVMEKKSFLLLHCPLICKLFGLRIANDKLTKILSDILETGMSERGKENSSTNIIHAMMDARDGKKKFTADEMLGQLFAAFAAGYNTTSDTLAYTFYELAVNPEVHKKLQEEIDSLLGKQSLNDINCINSTSLESRVSLQDINDLKYLDAVIKEATRLHTVAAFLERINSETFTLPPALEGSKPLIAKPGTTFYIPLDCIHHDPKYFHCPDKFDPNRFYGLDEKVIANTYTFLPFGIGPRHCVANRFSILLLKIVLIHMLSKCNIKTCPKTTIPLLKSKKSVMAVSECDIFLRFEKRLRE